MPWAKIEASLRKGETVERAGKAREREIVLLAAPTESQLGELIRNTRLLSSNTPTVASRVRKWTDATGRHSVEAEFMDVQDGKVRLKKTDSSVVSVPIERLSKADQEFVWTLTPRQSKENTPKSRTHRSAGTISYFEVRKDIKKYIGKEVAWVGKNVSSATMSVTTNGKTLDTKTEYQYALVDKNGNCLLGDSFSFSHPGTKNDTKRTPAAEAADNNRSDNGIRVIKGTIVGSKKIQIPGPKMDWQSIEVPDLTDVVIDVPPTR